MDTALADKATAGGACTTHRLNDLGDTLDSVWMLPKLTRREGVTGRKAHPMRAPRFCRRGMKAVVLMALTVSLVLFAPAFAQAQTSHRKCQVPPAQSNPHIIVPEAGRGAQDDCIRIGR
jgi:hypothetical protein